jgi:phage recombination protein Bet
MEQRQENALVRLSDEQVSIITQTIAKGAEPQELALFIQICNRTGLDPFTRQIYLVPRYDRALGRNVRQPQVSIDGARLVAQRSGEYEGQVPAMWCGEDGEWREVWLDARPPVAARVGVWRRAFREPTYAIALWREYAQRGRDGEVTGMWGKMPALMLSKCAEMLALRKAFPAELSGLYSAEEMAQADDPAPAPAPQAQEAPEKPRRKAATVAEVFDPVPAKPAPTALSAPAKRPPAVKWSDTGSDVVEVERIVPRGNGVSALLCSHATAGKAWVSASDQMVGSIGEMDRINLSWRSNGAYVEAVTIAPAQSLAAFRDEAGELCIPFEGK